MNKKLIIILIVSVPILSYVGLIEIDNYFDGGLHEMPRNVDSINEPEFVPNQLERIFDYCEKKNNLASNVFMNDIGLQYYNQTHIIDNNTCEWILKNDSTDIKFVYEVPVNGTLFDVEYTVSSGKISNMSYIFDTALMFDISSNTNGTISMKIPNELYLTKDINAIYSPLLLIDGEEVESSFEILENSTRLIFDFPKNAQTVEVVFAWHWS